MLRKVTIIARRIINIRTLMDLCDSKSSNDIAPIGANKERMNSIFLIGYNKPLKIRPMRKINPKIHIIPIVKKAN
jgi:hypothetical protein